MGIAYVVVGGVCVLLGAGFTIAYLVRPRYELITNTVKYALTNPIFAGNWVIIPTWPGIKTTSLRLQWPQVEMIECDQVRLRASRQMKRNKKSCNGLLQSPESKIKKKKIRKNKPRTIPFLPISLSYYFDSSPVCNWVAVNKSGGSFRIRCLTRSLSMYLSNIVTTTSILYLSPVLLEMISSSTNSNSKN